jgi:hypothetical protein
MKDIKLKNKNNEIEIRLDNRFFMSALMTRIPLKGGTPVFSMSKMYNPFLYNEFVSSLKSISDSVLNTYKMEV